MKLNLNKSKRISRWMGSAVLVGGLLSVGTVGSGLLTSCTDGYDLAERDPEWLGSSIYNYLESQGNYTYTTRMITDLGYKEVLAKTGSNTLFVADDAAYIRFFKKNDWGVSGYEDLTTTQKKLLLYGSLIKNACQVAYLSSSEGPVEGDCMRRKTSTTEYDTIPLLAPADMPSTSYWDYYRDNNKTITCAYDFTSTPMVHFIQAYLEKNLITQEDCKFITNNPNYIISDAYVNGVKIEEQNIKCSNGFVHKMADVITPLPNMAQLINQMPETSDYAKLLERFSAPYYVGDAATIEYNRLYNTSIDSLFQKRYFSERSQGGAALQATPGMAPVPATLKFDPGWNQFYSNTASSIGSDIAMMENMAVMLVPTNEALKKYFDGSTLQMRYGTWENVPDKVIAALLNVNMMNSFTSTVPSKFATVLNDANDEMNLEAKSVDRVVSACNGAIYITNKVYNPVSYISVSFPALINDHMNIIDWAISQCDFKIYLNSQQSQYSFFIPDSAALLNYIDPCSLGKPRRQLFQFHYDKNAISEEKKVWAAIYDVDSLGNRADSIGEASYEQVKNRLEDILNTHIVIGDVKTGNEYYQTKDGGMIRVMNASANENGMQVQGGYQKEDVSRKVDIAEYHDFVDKGGNGRTYVLHDQPLMTSTKSVYDILCEHDEFKEFRNLLEGSQTFLETIRKIGSDQHSEPSANISLFNTFRYTVYVPDTATIQKLHASGKLPTWEQVDAETDPDVKDSLTNEIETFVRYHIQDNSIYKGAGEISGQYETAAYKIVDGNLQYYKLKVNADDNGITVTDAKNEEHRVVTSKGLYNLMAREYQFDSSDKSQARNLYTSSYAVVHQIEGSLNYK